MTFVLPRFLSTTLILVVAVLPMQAAGGPDTADSWDVATPDSVGLNSRDISDLVRDIRAGEYSNIHGLLVVRHGKLVVEQYFEGKDERRGNPVGVVSFDANTLHDARSITKSVVSILFGIAVAQNAIADIDAPVLDYFPEYADLRSSDRLAIRLNDVLSMTSGFEWDESSRPYGDPENDETVMDQAADPYRYVLERPIAHEPGEVWEYSGGDTMLVAGIIEKAVGMSLQAYAEKVLFRPLGIDRYEWLTYDSGVPIAASGLRMRPRDMAKMGLLFLNRGSWRGEQIVPELWAERSLSAQAKISDRPFGFQRYGYQWWLGTARVRNDTVQWAAAVGWGGQRILIVPSMDLVAVVAAGLYRDPRQTDITFEILLDRVLPAVRSHQP